MERIFVNRSPVDSPAGVFVNRSNA